MARRLRLHVFVDALGWRVAEQGRAFPTLDVVRRPLTSQLGYSSACLPTILSGVDPQVHGHWNVFYRPRERPTFAAFRPLRHLPGLLRVPGRLQRPVSAALRAALGLRGHFAIHRLPVQRWHAFDVKEREDLFAPGGLPAAGSIVDDARASGRAWHVSDWRLPEAARWEALAADLRARRLDWAFLYLAELDGVLHRRGGPHAEVAAKLDHDARRLAALVREARGLGYEVQVAVFSDHGMAPVRRAVDLRAAVRRAVPAAEGRAYHALYDSTMARYWSDDPALLARLAGALAGQPGVRVLDEAALRAWGAFFPGGEYGQLVALVEPGVLIAPSDMGRRPVAGMHGYSPEHEDSHAALLTDFEPEVPAAALRDLRGLMRAGLAPVAGAA